MPRDRIYIFFIATYFAQGMIGIAYEPIYFLQKEGLGLSVSQSAVFTAWMTMPFLLKPLLGLWTDAFPIGGRRRVPYLTGAAAATAAGWAVLAFLGDYRYAPTLILLTLVNVGICFSDVLCDGVMVEHGKEQNQTGKFQAAQIGTLYLTLLVTGVGGGWLAQHASYRAVFALTALFPLLILFSARAVPDKSVPGTRPQARLLAAGLWELLRTRSFWATCLLILLFNFSPFKGTAWFYYQVDHLGFSKVFIGTLTSIGGVAGVAGAGLFWRFYNKTLTLFGRRLTLDTAGVLRISVAAGAPLSLLYLAYRGPATAVLLTALFGMAGVFMRLGLMDLAARATPRHAEATVFAIFMSVFNLAAWSSNLAGAKLYESMATGSGGAYGAMSLLIVIGAASIAACWPLLGPAGARKTA